MFHFLQHDIMMRVKHYLLVHRWFFLYYNFCHLFIFDSVSLPFQDILKMLFWYLLFITLRLRKILNLKQKTAFYNCCAFFSINISLLSVVKFTTQLFLCEDRMDYGRRVNDFVVFYSIFKFTWFFFMVKG